MVAKQLSYILCIWWFIWLDIHHKISLTNWPPPKLLSIPTFQDWYICSEKDFRPDHLICESQRNASKVFTATVSEYPIMENLPGMATLVLNRFKKSWSVHNIHFLTFCFQLSSASGTNASCGERHSGWKRFGQTSRRTLCLIFSCFCVCKYTVLKRLLSFAFWMSPKKMVSILFGKQWQIKSVSQTVFLKIPFLKACQSYIPVPPSR